MLIDDPDRFGDPSDQEALLALIDRRRAELTQEAALLGQRFFQDRPREFARHFWRQRRAIAQQTRPQQSSPNAPPRLRLSAVRGTPSGV